MGGSAFSKIKRVSEQARRIQETEIAKINTDEINGLKDKTIDDQVASKEDTDSKRLHKEMLQIFIKETEESIKEKESSLECPVCLETADIPIFRCSKEHLICSKCRHRISDCPLCRETYQENPERYRLAEKILKEVGKMKEQL